MVDEPGEDAIDSLDGNDVVKCCALTRSSFLAVGDIVCTHLVASHL